MLRLILSVLLLSVPAHAQDSPDNTLAGKPAFSLPEVPAQSSARCDALRAMAEGVSGDGDRVDLSVTGKLTLVKSDGALWYLVVCSDLRVMCVTYQGNDMKIGDTVEMRGAYRRLDANHAVLDPCLASAEQSP